MKSFSIKIILLGLWKFIKLLPKEYLIGLVLDIMEYIANKTDNEWDDVKVAELSAAYSKVFKNKR